MNGHDIAIAVSVFNLLAVLVGFSVFHLRSKMWTAAAASARIDANEQRISIAEANVRSLRADIDYFSHSYSATLDEVLKEVRSITRNGAKERDIDARLEELRDQVMALEQDVTGLPCFIGAKVLCDTDDKKEKP